MRTQYKSLIHMDGSSDLTMIDTIFDKVQTKAASNWGVITVNNINACPTDGCNSIKFDTGTVQYLNYGYNYSSTIY